MPFKTTSKGWGLMTLEDISPGKFVIEYVGEVITLEEAHNRLEKGKQKLFIFLYLC